MSDRLDLSEIILPVSNNNNNKNNNNNNNNNKRMEEQNKFSTAAAGPLCSNCCSIMEIIQIKHSSKVK